MSVERAGGGVTFVCDGCGDEHDAGTSDFTDALASLGDVRWFWFEDDEGDWVHLCPDCKDADEEEA